MSAMEIGLRAASEKYDAAINAARALPRNQRKAALDAAYAAYSSECVAVMDACGEAA